MHPVGSPSPAGGALPELDESDSYFRNALGELLGKKALVSFLALDGFARRVVATVNNLATDNAAAGMWPVNRTPGPLATEARAGGTQNLPRLVGRALAKELMWTARRFSAQEALEWRLVNHAVPKGQALGKAREIVDAMSKNGPLAIMMIKQAVNRGMDVPLMHGWYEEQDLAYLLAFSEDRDEGVTAFAEKRPPKFKGQ